MKPGGAPYSIRCMSLPGTYRAAVVELLAIPLIRLKLRTLIHAGARLFTVRDVSAAGSSSERGKKQGSNKGAFEGVLHFSARG